MFAIEIQDQLHELEAQRALALVDGFASSSAYVAVLEEEITAVRAAYVGAAVTEIATLRAELSGPQVG